MNKASSSSEIYHERQIKELCALHALNNLFQDKQAFSKKDLDDICQRLSPDHFINPHRSALGFGNYDVNVLMAAVQKKDCETIWFDKRKDTQCLVPDKIFGFILNTPTDYKWGILRLPFKRKHWIAIRKIGQYYYNLDSKLESPELIGGERYLCPYLSSQLEEGDKELLLIVAIEVARLGTWRRDWSQNGSKSSKLYDTNTSKTNETLINDKSATLPPRLQSVNDL